MIKPTGRGGLGKTARAGALVLGFIVAMFAFNGMSTRIPNMPVDTNQMNRLVSVMINSMGNMDNDILKVSNPQRMMPLVP